MLYIKGFGNVKKHLLTGFLMLIAVLVMMTPALANTQNWAFTGTLDGRIINGESNGVYHNMTAGTLINSGRIWVTATRPAPSSPQSWTFEVWKDNGLFDTKICTSNPVTPSTVIGQSVYFSKNCGSITAGNYYLIIYRAASDGRAVSGAGTLSS